MEDAVELCDGAGEAPAAADELACDPHLDHRFVAGELTSDPIEPDAAVECAERDLEGRVEFVQMPAQPLLRPAQLVGEVVAVVDQQLQLPQLRLLAPR